MDNKKKLGCILVIISLLLIFVSTLNRKTTLFQRQYKEYAKMVNKDLKNKDTLTPELLIKAQNIFKPENTNDKLINSTRYTTYERETLRKIHLISFFKLKLAEIKREYDNGYISKKDLKIKLKEFDYALIFLVPDNSDIVSKDNPINDYGKNLTILEFTEELKKDLGLDK